MTASTGTMTNRGNDESNTTVAAPSKVPSSSPAASKVSPSSSAAGDLVGWVWIGLAAYLIFAFGMAAYMIRMGAIQEYGRVIHEFDPYFNYRATEVSGFK